MTPDTWVDNPKRVFGPFYDGRGWVFADVAKVHRKLGACLDGEPNKVIEDSNSPDPEIASNATEKLVRAVRVAFDLPPFTPATGEGLTEDQCVETLNTFSDFLTKKETTPEPSPTSSPPTGKRPCSGCRH